MFIEDIYPTNPKLIYTRISGYGQTGPYAKRPGYASVCEGMGGFRFINGHSGEPPVRPNMSLGDSLAGLHAALGVLLGLVAKNKLGQAQAERTGQVVDVAIYESMLNMMEGVIPEYDRFNQVRKEKVEEKKRLFIYTYRFVNLLEQLLLELSQQTHILVMMENMLLSVVMEIVFMYD